METRGILTIERETPSDAVEDELVTSAELAECTCPEACERDHDRD
jgi:hypothetical protein